ncbi:MAG: BON domain-containing protein [Acidobacteria bacterium]|nr:BON domain-containing protein [Acidobacteriota bacterium]
MIRLTSNLLLLVVALAAAGTGGKPAVPPAHARTGKAAPAAADAAIESAIRQRFARSKAAADNLQVHVVGGVATIEGATDVVQRKGAATRMARAAGARQVVNKIVVSEAARDKANANLAKGRRRVQVRRSGAVRATDLRR